jgi:hypothetical protein
VDAAEIHAVGRAVDVDQRGAAFGVPRFVELETFWNTDGRRHGVRDHPGHRQQRCQPAAVERAAASTPGSRASCVTMSSHGAPLSAAHRVAAGAWAVKAGPGQRAAGEHRDD